MNEKTKSRGKIFFFSGPSGVGKGTLIDTLRQKHKTWVFPPSCTTRDPRPNEVDGETYFFITKDEFREKIKAGEFLEWAEVHNGNFYGTLKEKILAPIENGKIVIREFDVQGFLQARKLLDEKDFQGIFLTAKNGWSDLEPRILARAKISAEELESRRVSFENEVKNAKFYNKVFEVETGEQEKLLTDVERFIAEEVV